MYLEWYFKELKSTLLPKNEEELLLNVPTTELFSRKILYTYDDYFDHNVALFRILVKHPLVSRFSGL